MRLNLLDWVDMAAFHKIRAILLTPETFFGQAQIDIN